jgi:hypothetical protein
MKFLIQLCYVQELCYSMYWSGITSVLFGREFVLNSLKYMDIHKWL